MPQTCVLEMEVVKTMEINITELLGSHPLHINVHNLLMFIKNSN